MIPFSTSLIQLHLPTQLIYTIYLLNWFGADQPNTAEVSLQPNSSATISTHGTWLSISWGMTGVVTAHWNTHTLKFFLKFVGSTTCSTDGGSKGCYALALGEFKKLWHFGSWEADEVKCACSTSNTYIFHLQYNENTRLRTKLHWKIHR